MAIAMDMPWRIEAVPRIEVAGRFYHDDRGFRATYRSPRHALHLYDYAGRIRFDHETVAFRPGAVTLSPAGVVTRYDLPRPGRHWCVHFVAPPGRAARGASTTRLPLLTPAGRQRDYLVERLSRISQLHHTPRPTTRAAAAAALAELLLTLAAWHDATDTQLGPRTTTDAVDRVVDLVQRRLDRPIGVADMVNVAQLSQNYLAQRFKQRMGMTMPRYLLHARIERARLLLTTTDLPVKAIAARVGLPDAQHFNKQFRRLVGTSPSAYRETA